ncbi:hypothetical protein GGU11DRAFT_748145 [Lentinula aff. detonsa]|uniref:Uncharacterized protein n=1 Tax=Lentinula detonsa TaxID=2804962 RepID=A0AA38PV43_9AGAR|nr:hypothetical protein GGU11DRAFT_748145 [Lentinula aff. detonsa]KAJ3982320.1 hypothetical protein F5890DRAFT_1556008 [Lentinula detonsa]
MFKTDMNLKDLEESQQASPSESLAMPTPAILTMNGLQALPILVAGTPTAHPVTSPSLVDFLQGTATTSIPSSHVSITNHYKTHLMFQAFVDFFDGPITVAHPSSTTASSSESVASSLSGSLMGDLSAPSLTMALPVSIAPPALDGFRMNSRVSLIIMCVVTVSTVVLFIWPALRAKRLCETRMVLKHKKVGMHARVFQAREELSKETEGQPPDC